MTAGMPGTGIGGLFYVAAALISPLRNSIPTRVAVRIAALAVGVLAGIFITGWFLGWLLVPAVKPVWKAGSSAPYPPESENIVRWASLLASFVLLSAVLLFVQAARLIQKLRCGK